jgi:hypothetical protein
MKIDTFFFQQGFIKSKGDPNIYIENNENGHIVLISLYIDDIIIIENVDELIEEIKRLLS